MAGAMTLAKPEFAVLLFGAGEAGDGAGGGDGTVADEAGVGDDFAFLIEVHVL